MLEVCYKSRPILDLLQDFCKGIKCSRQNSHENPWESVLAERSWSAMNLILNKTRNSMGAINVDKVMYIYMNERTLHRPIDAKERLQFTMGLALNEADLVDMEDRLIQEELGLTQQNIEIEGENRMEEPIREKNSSQFNEAEGSMNASHKRWASRELEHENKRPSFSNVGYWVKKVETVKIGLRSGTDT